MVRSCSLMRPTVIKLLIESAPQKLPLLMTGSPSKSHGSNLLKRLHVNKRLCHSDAESTSACKVYDSYQKLIHLYWSERGRIKWDFTSLHFTWASLVAQTIKIQPAMWETWVRSLSWEDPLEEGMATHSSILAWRISIETGAWRATVHGASKSWTWLCD